MLGAFFNVMPTSTFDLLWQSTNGFLSWAHQPIVYLLVACGIIFGIWLLIEIFDPNND